MLRKRNSNIKIWISSWVYGLLDSNHLDFNNSISYKINGNIFIVRSDSIDSNFNNDMEEKEKINMKIIKITYKDIYNQRNNIMDGTPHIFYSKLKVYGVPRGGMYIAPLFGEVVDNAESAEVIVDDLEDSGATRRKYEEMFPNKKFIALFKKESADQWYEFPWDVKPEMEVGQNVTRILQYLGEDSAREGLKETPARYIKFLKEFYDSPEFRFTMFKNEGIDEMILVKDIPFYSLCEHHMAPFFGTASIAYIPNDSIVGISKLPRTLEKFARRLQNQERITHDVADFLMKALMPKGVAVVLKARHLCMEMRGVKKPGACTITSHMAGIFKDDLNCRQEFLKLIEI